MSHIQPSMHPPGSDEVPGLEPIEKDIIRLRQRIEREILPGLLVASRAGPIPPKLGYAMGALLGTAAVEEFVSRLRQPDDTEAGEMVDALVEGGTTAEAVYLDLLTPATRRLGELWEEDGCDFVEVTIALGRMQQILRSLSDQFQREAPQPVGITGRALLAGTSEDQHTLGLLLVAEYFVRDGWQVELGPPITGESVETRVRREWFDLVGLSASCDVSVPAIVATLKRVRERSRNPDIRILVGGAVVERHPQFADEVGGDGSVNALPQALKLARELVHTN